MDKTKKLKEYTYYFIGGGWNSEWAYTKAQAKKQAIAKGWGHEIDFDSFHIAEDYLEGLKKYIEENKNKIAS